MAIFQHSQDYKNEWIYHGISAVDFNHISGIHFRRFDPTGVLSARPNLNLKNKSVYNYNPVQPKLTRESKMCKGHLYIAWAPITFTYLPYFLNIFYLSSDHETHLS